MASIIYITSDLMIDQQFLKKALVKPSKPRALLEGIWEIATCRMQLDTVDSHVSWSQVYDELETRHK